MTPTRRIAKLEAQNASLRKRLDARTTQLILLLNQLSEIKEVISAEYGLVLELKSVEDDHEEQVCQPGSHPGEAGQGASDTSAPGD